MNSEKLGKRYYSYESAVYKDINKAMLFTMRDDEQAALDIVRRYRAIGVDARIIEMGIAFTGQIKDHTPEYQEYNAL